MIGNNRSSNSNSNLKYNTNIRIAKKGETGLPFIENYRKGDADTDYYEFNNTNIPWYNHSRNLDDWTNYNTQENPINWNACGGRKYAYGGETEDVGMPLNMPQGYNAINEGGMHEQNPNGGVPYGMNSDGSQNLVEEGEASVGNNIVILFKITCKNLYKTIKLKKNKTINKNQNITHKKKSFQNQVLEGLNLK